MLPTLLTTPSVQILNFPFKFKKNSPHSIYYNLFRGKLTAALLNSKENCQALLYNRA